MLGAAALGIWLSSFSSVVSPDAKRLVHFVGSVFLGVWVYTYVYFNRAFPFSALSDQDSVFIGGVAGGLVFFLATVVIGPPEGPRSAAEELADSRSALDLPTRRSGLLADERTLRDYAQLWTHRVQTREKASEAEADLRRVEEQRPQSAPGFADLLRLAAAEADAERELAQKRKDRLFRLGVALIALSVLMPMGSAVMYWLIDPMPVETVNRLAILDGPLPAGVQVQVQRDWRILLGGVSLGFLFLAAARGLMTQHERQERRYSQLADRTVRIDVLRSALKIPEYAENEADRNSLRRAALTYIMETERDLPETSSAAQLTDGTEWLKEIRQLGAGN